MKKEFFIGVDVSKLTLDVFVKNNGQHFVVPNNRKGYRELLSRLKGYGIEPDTCWFIFEHTGIYSMMLDAFLAENHICYSKVSGLEIKRSLGITRGKTDKADAKQIAGYGYMKRDELKPSVISSSKITILKGLLSLRDKMVGQRAGYISNVKELVDCLGLKQSDIMVVTQKKMINALDKQIEKVEAEILALLKSEESLNKNYNLLQSIPGIGFVVASYMICYTDNFNKFKDARKFACYCGIAPFEHSSGTSVRGKTRVSLLSNRKIKSLLDLAAKGSLVHNPEVKAYYERRLRVGKSKMSTINIVRNKIVYRVFAVIKRGTPYTKLEGLSQANLEMSKS
jgi:transposase